jgi:hypothetical protein
MWHLIYCVESAGTGTNPLAGRRENGEKTVIGCGTGSPGLSSKLFEKTGTEGPTHLGSTS